MARANGGAPREPLDRADAPSLARRPPGHVIVRHARVFEREPDELAAALNAGPVESSSVFPTFRMSWIYPGVASSAAAPAAGKAPMKLFELTVSRTIDATPDQVFDAWTDPPKLASREHDRVGHALDHLLVVAWIGVARLLAHDRGLA